LKTSLLLQPLGSGSGGKHSLYTKSRLNQLHASELLHKTKKRFVSGLGDIERCYVSIRLVELMSGILMRLDLELVALKGRRYMSLLT
jgi:hypothetical protein